MVILKKLFHVVTYEQKDGEYNFYLTADTEVKDSEIERILSNHYERESRDRVFLTFAPDVNHKNKKSGFHIYIASLDFLNDKVLKNVREYSPDEMIDIKIFEKKRPFR